MKTSNRVISTLTLFFILIAELNMRAAITSGKDCPNESQPPAGGRLALRTMLNSIGMELVYIEPGEFLMGSISRHEIAAKYGGGQGDYAHEEPLHLVQITESFWMSRTEVTRGQFRRFIEDSGYKTTAEQRGTGGGMTKDGWGWVKGLNWQSAGIEQTDDHPVVQVSWYDATEFCKWLSEKEKRRYVLPAEAQWEYACRAGGETAFCWGDELDGGREYANMADESTQRWINGYKEMKIDTSPWDDGYGATAPVGSFKPNAWGLYDMHGNACEWCSDLYDHDYYQNSPGFDPKGPIEGLHRVLRGGSWVRHPRLCRSASRHSIAPTFRSVGRGFRIVLLELPAD